MRKIQMVDLLRQYEEIQSEIDQAVLSTIRSTIFINGPQVKTFQSELEKYLQVKNVIPCANGTDALQVAMMALDLKPGDEVITASFTYVAAAEAIALLQLTPVLVDVDPDTFCIDPEEIKKAITPKTKAIVAVHLFGQCADMEEILAIAEENKLYVIEDAAQAIGAEYTFRDGTVKKAGTMGTIGCTSFFPSKNLGCYGDGGAIMTDNDDLATRIKKIANHGQAVKYYHDEIGVNSRLDTIQAAVLLCKLPHLDTYNKKRFETALFYNAEFAEIEKIITPSIHKQSSHVFHQYTLRLKGVDRSALQAFLAEKDIPTMIYYPVPVHLQQAYKTTKGNEAFPVSTELSREVLSLPMSPNLDEEQLHYIATHLKTFFNQ